MSRESVYLSYINQVSFALVFVCSLCLKNLHPGKCCSLIIRYKFWKNVEYSIAPLDSDRSISDDDDDDLPPDHFIPSADNGMVIL